MSMYEIGKFINLVPRPRPVSITCSTLVLQNWAGPGNEVTSFIVYKFPVQFTGIFCYLQVTSLQYSLQQIVVTYKSLTNQ